MDPTNYLAQYQLCAHQLGQARAQGRKGRWRRAFPESKRESVCESVYAREFMCDRKGRRRRRVKQKGGRVAFMDVKNAHVCTPCLIKQALNLGGQTPGEKLQFYTIKIVLC
jgi:hypothetical protein